MKTDTNRLWGGFAAHVRGDNQRYSGLILSATLLPREMAEWLVNWQARRSNKALSHTQHDSTIAANLCYNVNIYLFAWEMT